MASLKIISDGVLFRNPRAGHRVVNSYLPSVLALSESEWVGVHRRGTAFYSHDGVLAVLRSTDEGATWKEEGLVWDPREDGASRAYSAPFLSQMRDGALVLSAMRWDCSDPDRLMVNPETGAFLPVETILFRSQDNGRSWSAPQVIEMPGGIIAYLSGPVIEMPGGGWFLAFDLGKAYDDPRRRFTLSFRDAGDLLIQAHCGQGGSLSGYARFLGIFWLFFENLKREAAGVGPGDGSWAMGGGVEAGFVMAFCPDLPGFLVFGILDGDGRVDGLDGVSPLAPVQGLADGLGGG